MKFKAGDLVQIDAYRGRVALVELGTVRFSYEHTPATYHVWPEWYFEKYTQKINGLDKVLDEIV